MWIALVSIVAVVALYTNKPSLQERNLRSLARPSDWETLHAHLDTLEGSPHKMHQKRSLATQISEKLSLARSARARLAQQVANLKQRRDFLDGSLPWWTEWNTLQALLHPADPAYKTASTTADFGFFPTNTIASLTANGSPEIASLLSAPTPPMGFNTWNTLDCNITETQVREVMDAMVARGLTNAGYEYVILDDCWTQGRDPATNKLVPNTERFPSGIKSLADYAHARGMKLGIYSNAGPLTCLSNPGSLEHETIDAQTWSEWGIDYVKYDNCFTTSPQCPNCPSAQERYTRMGKALALAARPVVFSINDWGTSAAWKWTRTAGGTSYRTTSDVCNAFSGKGSSVGTDDCSILSVLDRQPSLVHHGGPGHWGDLDVLQVGIEPLTLGEQLSQLVLWSALKSPLMISADVRNIDESILSILTHEEVLAVNQDPMGVSARLVARWVKGGMGTNELTMDKLTTITYEPPQKLEIAGPGSFKPPEGTVGEVWMGPLSQGRFVVVITNRSPEQRYFAVKLSLLAKDISFYAPTKKALLEEGLFVRDVVQRKDLGVARKSISYDLPSHHSAMLILSIPSLQTFTPPSDAVGVDWWTCLPGYNLPAKMSKRGHPSCMSLGDGCHFLPDEATCRGYAAHPPPQAMEFSCGPQHLAKFSNDGYGTGTWCSAARTMLWVNPSQLPRSMVPAWTCLQSCQDKGHYVRILDKSGPEGLMCLGNATADTQGVVTSRCSWFVDPECKTLAPGSTYPTQGVANGVVCPPDAVGGWCLTAKQQMRSNWPNVMSQGPVASDCSKPPEMWQCIQSCQAKGYFLKARDVGGYGSASLACQVYPGSPKDCVFYYDSKCSVPMQRPGLALPSPMDMTSRTCTQTERGWCQDLFGYFRMGMSVVQCPVRPVPLSVVQESGVHVQWEQHATGQGRVASDVTGIYDDGMFYIQESHE